MANGQKKKKRKRQLKNFLKLKIFIFKIKWNGAITNNLFLIFLGFQFNWNSLEFLRDMKRNWHVCHHDQFCGFFFFDTIDICDFVQKIDNPFSIVFIKKLYYFPKKKKEKEEKPCEQLKSNSWIGTWRFFFIIKRIAAVILFNSLIF